MLANGMMSRVQGADHFEKTDQYARSQILEAMQLEGKGGRGGGAATVMFRVLVYQGYIMHDLGSLLTLSEPESHKRRLPGLQTGANCESASFSVAF